MWRLTRSKSLHPTVASLTSSCVSSATGTAAAHNPMRHSQQMNKIVAVNMSQHLLHIHRDFCVSFGIGEPAHVPELME
jgi:hypothetical protein